MDGNGNIAKDQKNHLKTKRLDLEAIGEYGASRLFQHELIKDMLG